MVITKNAIKFLLSFQFLINFKPSTSTASTRWKIPLKRATQQNESSKSNILPNICIFCVKGCKKCKRSIIDIGKCEAFDPEVTVRNAAKYLKDETLLPKSGRYEFGNGPDFAVEEAKYHHVYKREFTNEARDAKKLGKFKSVFRKKSKVCCIKWPHCIC